MTIRVGLACNGRYGRCARVRGSKTVRAQVRSPLQRFCAWWPQSGFKYGQPGEPLQNYPRCLSRTAPENCAKTIPTIKRCNKLQCREHGFQCQETGEPIVFVYDRSHGICDFHCVTLRAQKLEYPVCQPCPPWWCLPLSKILPTHVSFVASLTDPSEN
jgi:hypothetical protein